MTANPKGHEDIPVLVSLISGGVAGAIEAASTYPFEFAKTRVQLPSEITTKRISRDPYAEVARIFRSEGIHALYKGCSILVLGSVGKDAVRFLFFDTIKNVFKDPETER